MFIVMPTISSLSHFKGSQLPSSVLRLLTLIDMLGIWSGDTQCTNRGYDFTKVVSWFAHCRQPCPVKRPWHCPRHTRSRVHLQHHMQGGDLHRSCHRRRHHQRSTINRAVHTSRYQCSGRCHHCRGRFYRQSCQQQQLTTTTSQCRRRQWPSHGNMAIWSLRPLSLKALPSPLFDVAVL